jgi:hypothetical protein
MRSPFGIGAPFRNGSKKRRSFLKDDLFIINSKETSKAMPFQCCQGCGFREMTV